ncbi:MAG: MoaD/ThiS family protein [Saprospiraceae bacterium]|jgi:molybdopterin converting factor subunit 1|nr:MoaD/ThiS family protein [Saprospiraceae bacterium]|tara:strand:- start:6049 stop:6291 length:243 start_codon:yes stop_codon:yes gene_type:complete
MKLKIKAFGIARDFLGESTNSFKLESGNCIADLKSALSKKYPEFEKIKAFTIAVNQEYQEDDFNINEGDELAIIPPVSGG